VRWLEKVERVVPNALSISVERIGPESALKIVRATMKEYPGKLYHKTPAWVASGAQFHLRFRAEPTQAPDLTATALAPPLLAAAHRYHGLGRWWCELFLLMPDHLHAMIIFPHDAGMSPTIRDWKRGTARCHGLRWQENYFDHRIRNEKEAQETWLYIRRNPVVKGLCARVDDWPWWIAPAGGTRCP
jgi:putative transposase